VLSDSRFIAAPDEKGKSGRRDSNPRPLPPQRPNAKRHKKTISHKPRQQHALPLETPNNASTAQDTETQISGQNLATLRAKLKSGAALTDSERAALLEMLGETEQGT